MSIFTHWNSHIFAIPFWFICRLKLAYPLLACMSALLYVILVDVGSAELHLEITCVVCFVHEQSVNYPVHWIQKKQKK